MSIEALTGQMDQLKICGLVCTESKKPVPLQSIDVSVAIKGFVANVNSDLTYINKEEEVVGAIFIFPLDEQSAVYHFEADIDGKIITAECQDKDQARQTFKDATEQGHTAFLLEESGDTGDVFKCQVGNLPPDKPVKVTFRYVVELSTEEDGSVRFLLPTILNPRYNPSPQAGGSRNVPNVAFAASGDIPYHLNFKGTITSSCGVEEVKSDRDSLVWTQAFNDNTAGQLSLASTYKFDHDLALNVFYNDHHKPFVILEKGDDTKEGFLKQDVLMLNFIPDLAEQKENPTQNEYIFIVDRSGSMQGPRIENAKETLLFFLKSLPVGCFFNILSFGSRFEELFQGGSKAYSEDTLREAMQLQQTMTANFGGTELLKPLEHMYGQQTQAGFSRQVFLLTDGQVCNTKEITSLVEENSTTTRVFSFGIGTGASTALVKGIARAGKGIAEFIVGKERLQAKVMNTLKLASQPALCDIQTHYNIPVIPFPTRAPPLYSGHRLIMYALVQQQLTSHTDVEMSITGQMRDLDVTHTFTFPGTELVGNNDDAQAIHRLCAKAQIKQLEEDEELSRSQGRNRRGAEKPKPVSEKDTIILLSITANVISRYTSFVGLDKDTKQALPSQGPRYSRVPTAMNCSSGIVYQNFGAPPMNRTMDSGGMFHHSPSGRATVQQAMPMRRKMCSASRARCRMAPVHHEMAMDGPSMAMGGPSAGLLPERQMAPQPKGLMVQSAGFLPERQMASPPKGLSGLVALQTFKGSWTLDEQLAQLIGVSIDAFKNNSPIKNLEAWATVVALAWLEKEFTNRKEDWLMLAEKASIWLQQQDLEEKSEEFLKMKAVALL